MEIYLRFLFVVITNIVIVYFLCSFLETRYQRRYQKQGVYGLIKMIVAIGIAIENVWVDNPIVTMFIWLIVGAFIATALYESVIVSNLKRTIESEVFVMSLGVVEALIIFSGEYVFSRWYPSASKEIKTTICSTVYILIIFVFYQFVIHRLLPKQETKVSPKVYILDLISIIFTVANIILIILCVPQLSYIILTYVFCLVVADIFLLYLINEIMKNTHLQEQISMMEQQAKQQYEYYHRQELRYDDTLRILHDTNKHIKALEQLSALKEWEDVSIYTRQINETLKPLIPQKYTCNPILDILLTDKKNEAEKQGITFRIEVDQVKLVFIEPMDVTTIFGNLIDNAMEATQNVDSNKYIHIKISSYHEMVLVKIENSSLPVEWRAGIPVSNKGKDRGIGLVNVRRSIEKYDGNLKLKENDDLFIAELFLNS